MTITGISVGVDMVDCARVARMLEEDATFLELAFTEGERADCGRDAERLAVRWAAKEATMKALGRGIGVIAPLDIEVRHDDHGAPLLALTGSAQARAEELGMTQWSVSLSHEEGSAVAFVIMMKGEGGD
ncbi:holo-ACP synthase [Cellulosimicrobium funkei]|uniref:holo-ACP synthase n=1 Tax=Cellulosimicrobium funkei TaxID=264251 RepID=UPI003D75451F